MTHFTVGIIIPPQSSLAVDHFIAHQMAPYDENLTVPPYVSYSVAQAEKDIADELKRFQRIVERADPLYDLAKCREHIETLRATTPQARYDERIAYHEAFNAQGEPISRMNPHAKWDWYVTGGRWDGWIFDLDRNSERVQDNIASTEHAILKRKLTHAIITPDGVWHEHGRMGWFGILLTENDDWDAEALNLLTQYPKHQIIIIDAHI